MDDEGYRRWLGQRRPKLKQSSIDTYVRDARRVEKCCGDLDDHIQKDGLEEVLQELQFTEDDRIRGAPNPSRLRIKPKIPGNYRVLKDYARTIEYYRAFRSAG